MHSSNLGHSLLRIQVNPEDVGSMFSPRTTQYNFSPLWMYVIEVIKRVISWKKWRHGKKMKQNDHLEIQEVEAKGDVKEEVRCMYKEWERKMDGSNLKVKGKGRLWVLQHCYPKAYCTLTRMSSFIHLQRRCTRQAAWEISASEERNYVWNLASNP